MDRRAAVRIAHDVSLAAWFGGAWMGAVGLNGATIEVDDHTQRTRVANAGWFGWAPVAGGAMAVHLAATAVSGRFGGARGRAGPGTGDGSRRLGRLRVATTAAAVGSTIGAGLVGRRVVQAGDVPVATAVRPIRATPAEVAEAQRWLRVLQWVVPVSTGALWVLETLQSRR